MASVTFEEMDEVNQKSKNTKADHDTLKKKPNVESWSLCVYLGDRPQPDFKILGLEKMEVK